MATLNMRYGGKIVSLPEGKEFNANYGTARLNIKVNSTSTLKFGLTTNTNATQYCGLGLKLKDGKTAHIGRAYSTYYTYYDAYSGNNEVKPEKGYVVGDELIMEDGAIGGNIRRETAVNTTFHPYVDKYKYSTTGMSVKVTSVSTKVTNQQTASYTRNAGNGSGTVAANPGVRIVTNATGSWYTTRTASEAIKTFTYYSYSYCNTQEFRTRVRTVNRTWPAVGANKTYTAVVSEFVTRDNGSFIQHVTHTNLNNIQKNRAQYTVTYQNEPYTLAGSSTVSTTRRLSKTSASNQTTGSTAGVWKTTQTYTNTLPDNGVTETYTAIWRTLRNSYTSKQTTKASIVSTSKTTYVSRYSSEDWAAENYTVQAIQTTYRYSTRWSYWWTSCSKYTNTTYFTGSTSLYATTYYSEYTFISDERWVTFHNMNI